MFRYDNAGRLDQYTPGAATAAQTIGWDRNNNRTQMGGTTFTYNPDNSIKRTGAAAADNGYFPFGGLKTDECAD